ncbi:MAG: NADH-quinone oxidoreductase subunit L [Burkholderiales bacterium]|nr:NADH-quinone oxidoreductase subunit L [Burkholderiales bacterium]
MQQPCTWVLTLVPAVLMWTSGFATVAFRQDGARYWRVFTALSIGAAIITVLNLALTAASPVEMGLTHSPEPGGWWWLSPFGACLAMLVQVIGTVIGIFSARYLSGEPGQRRYVAAFSVVLGLVQLLIVSDHWLMIIVCWAMTGVALERLLCFYTERPFAQLAALKKRAADRLADVFLIAAAGLAYWQVGSGSIFDLMHFVASHGTTPVLEASALCLVVAVIFRTALMPAHGWLIQVMEAPTPVSALLHAGVVNLGGFVLIRFAPLISHAPWARGALVAFGLMTAVFAGIVMLTRISIKVGLAWSTVAQMGFMVLECGLGLYSLAAMHIIGHSLYKAHRFLAASTVVRETRLRQFMQAASPSVVSLVAAPVAAMLIVFLAQSVWIHPNWPRWWSVILAFAWSPLLWLPANRPGHAQFNLKLGVSGLVAIAGLTLLTSLGHLLPFGLHDTPNDLLGLLTLTGMALLYGIQATLRVRPDVIEPWRRWSYAGYYLDERYTRLILRWRANTWMPKSMVHPAVASQTSAYAGSVR